MDTKPSGIFVLAVSLIAGVALLSACAGDDSPGGTPRGPIELIDLSGHAVDPFVAEGASASVFVFMRVDCPVSNRYAPELSRLADEFASRGVRFVLIYPNPDATAETIQAHLSEYDLDLPALRDPDHRLVGYVEATITPEAAVFGPSGEMAYRGRIDNRYVDFGKTRARATEHELEWALEALLESRPVPTPRTDAVGCFIADLS